MPSHCVKKLSQVNKQRRDLLIWNGLAHVNRSAPFEDRTTFGCFGSVFVAINDTLFAHVLPRLIFRHCLRRNEEGLKRWTPDRTGTLECAAQIIRLGDSNSPATSVMHRLARMYAGCSYRPGYPYMNVVISHNVAISYNVVISNNVAVTHNVGYFT